MADLSKWAIMQMDNGKYDDGKQQIKHSFPEFIRGKHAVLRTAMLEKCLKKQGQEPVRYKKNKYDH